MINSETKVRLINFIVAIVACFILSPLLLMISLLVWSKLGSPILYRQKRTGLHGELFDLIKFRSMTDKTDEKGRLLSDDKRLSPFGIWLRSTSLDELPEMWNVLRGEMNIVGPRPLLEPYLKRYNSFQKRRHEVKPGLTGWAQVNGRNAISWNEKFKLDVWYVDSRSIWLDFLIILKTVQKVLQREGVNQQGEATMSEFMGSATTRVCHR